MTAFVLVAVCLLAGALLFLLPPLWRRQVPPGVDAQALTVSVYRSRAAELDGDLAIGQIDATQHAEARQELERGLAMELPEVRVPSAVNPGLQRLPVWLLAMLLPLGAVGVYWQTGTPEALQMLAQSTATPADGHPLSKADILAMIGKLAARLAEQPADKAGWAMLGRSYTALGRYNDAATAFGRAVELDDTDVGVLIEYADLLGVLQGKDLRGRPAALVQRALELDPNQPKALALAGTVAFNEHQYVQAADFWQRLLRLLPPGSDGARGVAGSIAEAKALAAGKPAPAKLPPVLATVSGAVRLAPELAARVRPDDTVFIFARASAGPPMPLAVLRRQVRDLPLTFSLDDSMAMASGMALSAFESVMVGARVSRAGSATPASGDLHGLTGPVALGKKNIDLVIDRVAP
jgi:cytochrome c-type biogenesis protein CcmH